MACPDECTSSGQPKGVNIQAISILTVYSRRSAMQVFWREESGPAATAEQILLAADERFDPIEAGTQRVQAGGERHPGVALGAKCRAHHRGHVLLLQQRQAPGGRIVDPRAAIAATEM